MDELTCSRCSLPFLADDRPAMCPSCTTGYLWGISLLDVLDESPRWLTQPDATGMTCPNCWQLFHPYGVAGPEVCDQCHQIAYYGLQWLRCQEDPVLQHYL